MNKLVIIFCVIALYGASYSAVEGASRIVGGIAAQENQFRYMVSLQERSQRNQTTRGHRCGGALVSYRHALTTASCLYNNNTGRFTQIRPRDYWLFAGSARLDNNATFLLQSIERFTIHPQFDPRVRFVNDIAIITAFSNFPTDWVRVLNLPYADVITTPYMCHSPGWGGYDSSTNASVNLLYTTSYPTTNSPCSTFYRNQSIAITMTPNMLCAIPYTNTSGCQGDSGNPLVCNNEILGVQFLSKNCSLPVTDLPWNPDVYTRVFRYKDWIEGIVIGRQPLPSAASTFQLCYGLLALLVIVQILTSKS
ncbi:anionic trypsin-2-like isoform X1 [Helicoverpa armigera]|uniref:anionic trypsin-2-like isoform X1 n=1 Tax=Helicoverpa armigera TaxID=29058 RepID=UPI00308396E2